MSDTRFDAAAALAPLKTFQRRTVDYVFHRLYGDQDPVRQFLVADEVGLGKTMVARGVIARTIETLWDTTDRIDILYICSNQAIAAQNLNRLNVLDRKELALPTRMTLVPLQVRGDHGLDANKVNFVSLTPGTTFDLKSTTGVTQERAFLFRLLEERVSRPRGLYNLLRVGAGVDGWNSAVRDLTLKGVDQDIISRFCSDVEAHVEVFEELEAVCDLFPRRRETYPQELNQRRNALVGELRRKLSHACIDALKPDLIIMDEFQRFRELLHGNSPAAELAQELFDYSDGTGLGARTLLLSATPYRMLTLSGDEPEDGEHYQDFLDTLSFLYGRSTGPKVAETLAREMREFRGFLHALPSARSDAIAVRKTVENRLRQVMARTERVGNTIERDSMVSEPRMTITVEAADLKQAAAVSDVARALDAPEITEYWKSAPYLLNFMRDYALKRLLNSKLGRPSSLLREAIRSARPAMLDHDRLDQYEPIEPANGRMRSLMDEVFGAGLDRHLWIPPALAYYGDEPSGPPLTKALIFSSWSMVPDAIAAILSYEAERRMGVGASSNYFARVRPRPLQFRQDQGRPVAMRAINLVYPSPTLARLADPLVIFAEQPGKLSLVDMRKAVVERLSQSIDGLSARTGEITDGRDWEWAAPAVIDALAGAQSVAWVDAPYGFAAHGQEEGFKEHIAELRSASSERSFGPVGPALIDLLVDIALGSPAICALRALHRIAPDLDWDDHRLLAAASQIAWGFRTLFNQHDAVALLRKGDDDRYWHHVLTYGAEHNLQAMLDEYVHYLVDAEGLGARSSAERVSGISKAVAAALSIRPSQIEVDDPVVEGTKVVVNKFQMRGRFAMRLADYKDEEGGAARLGSVRDAFNSPFRPFALATTSIGQEGLDFHPYCYRIYHWNLPGNPVDLEQREGRIHRFKGHAIRLNIAERQIDAIRGAGGEVVDPWHVMFAAARAQTDIDTDLIPYWIYEGSVKVERRVPTLPFSREVRRLEWLKRSLTVYRLAFGQPRQEDLLEYLHSLMEDEMSAEDIAELQIRLVPPAQTASAQM